MELSGFILVRRGDCWETSVKLERVISLFGGVLRKFRLLGGEKSRLEDSKFSVVERLILRCLTGDLSGDNRFIDSEDGAF